MRTCPNHPGRPGERRGLCRSCYEIWRRSPEGRAEIGIRRNHLPAAEVLAEVDKSLALRGMTEQEFCLMLAERFGGKATAYDRRARRARNRGSIALGFADQMLVALDRTLSELPCYEAMEAA